jgi:hypothetical protein
MEMNKNKLIFSIIGWVILLLIIIIVLTANGWKNPTNINTQVKDFKIWVIWDNNNDFLNLITDFKTIYPKYKTSNISIESFSDYEEYSYALSSAIASWEAPDIFVLNNNEKDSMFNGQISWLNPEIFNPNDFRTKMKWVFSDDLITTYNEWEEEKEILKWIPVWYEALWIFYNWRYVNDSDLSYISWLNSLIAEIRKQKPNFTPIWIWNGSTVFDAADIVTQFFMLESWVDKINDIVWNKLKEPLWTYLYFWDESSDNSYNSKFVELKTLWNDNLDLFSKWEIFMVVWYPRMIKQIDENWYSSNLLRASPFPHYFAWEWKTLINYNYFVINKDTSYYDLSNDFLSYLISDNWAWNYLSKFKYYLPALLSLESDKLEEKIHDDYKIVLKNFVDKENDYLLSSFDKWIKNIYDRNIISILDNSTNYESEFMKFRSKLICQTKKIVNLENLSQDCK